MSDRALERELLRSLEDGGTTIRELVDILDADHATVRTAMDALEKDGHVSASSRGYFEVYALTQRGRDRIEAT